MPLTRSLMLTCQWIGVKKKSKSLQQNFTLLPLFTHLCCQASTCAGKTMQQFAGMAGQRQIELERSNSSLGFHLYLIMFDMSCMSCSMTGSSLTFTPAPRMTTLKKTA